MASTTAKVKVRQSYIELRGLNLGTAFIREAQLQPGQKLPMLVEGLDPGQTSGTLDKSGFVGGLAILYRGYDLKAEDTVSVEWDGTVLRLAPRDKSKITDVAASGNSDGQMVGPDHVFERNQLRHIHIAPFSPGNLESWLPHSEPDVYLVFGRLSELTDYRYCCGASKELLQSLGYKSATKPDAILIDAATGQYLMAEFKMLSKDFKTNHGPTDVDVLVCWVDDETDKKRLPKRVLELKSLIDRAIQEGAIDL